MGNWFLTIELAEYWQDENLPFKEKRDAIVARIRSSKWRRLTPYPDSFTELVDALAVTSNLAEFDSAFNELCDLADNDGVRIETIVKVKS